MKGFNDLMVKGYFINIYVLLLILINIIGKVYHLAFTPVLLMVIVNLCLYFYIQKESKYKFYNSIAVLVLATGIMCIIYSVFSLLYIPYVYALILIPACIIFLELSIKEKKQKKNRNTQILVFILGLSFLLIVFQLLLTLGYIK